MTHIDQTCTSAMNAMTNQSSLIMWVEGHPTNQVTVLATNDQSELVDDEGCRSPEQSGDCVGDPARHPTSPVTVWATLRTGPQERPQAHRHFLRRVFRSRVPGRGGIPLIHP